MEKDEHFYNKAYLQGGYKNLYHKSYKESLYLPLWEKALELVKEVKEPKIIEIGCGAGQFANLLFDHGIFEYKGIDYSQEAISLAKRTNERFAEFFFVENAYQSQIYQDQYNIVILLEVLEHLTEDLFLLNKIRKASIVLFSVPNFNSESHVRFFKKKTDITRRYGKILRMNDIYSFNVSKQNTLYLVKSIK